DRNQIAREHGPRVRIRPEFAKMLRQRRRFNLSNRIGFLLHHRERLSERGSISLTPKWAAWDADLAASIFETIFAIAREEERTVKIDIISRARENARRSHAQGRPN